MGTADTMDTASLGRASKAPTRRLALVILWSRHEPWRVGETLVLGRASSSPPQMIGRGEEEPEPGTERARWVRQHPGWDEPTEPMTSPGISRSQLLVRVQSAGIGLENRGRRRLLVGGKEVAEAVLAVGDQAELENELVLLATRRPPTLPETRWWDGPHRAEFGRADRFGIVGESPAAWAMRDELAFAARQDLHVLLLGATGTGKELAARAIHALADTGRPLVARNAATLPAGLIEAELFGNVKDYPNPGMKERQGIVGAADGSTLFLDEVGELPEDQQARLLRVLDSGGEHHRLGEDRARTSRFRLIAATNRSVDRIKHDLLARLSVRVELPRLAERPEDVALIARHLVLEMAKQDTTVRERFTEASDRGPQPRLRPDLVRQLVREPLELGVRELSSRLWDAVRRSDGEWLAAARNAERPAPATSARIDPKSLDPKEIRAALEASGWVIARAYRALGLESRHVLHRLMRRHRIERPKD